MKCGSWTLQGGEPDFDARLQGHQRGADERGPHVLQPLRQEPQAAARAQGVPLLSHLARLQHPRRQAGRRRLPAHHVARRPERRRSGALRLLHGLHDSRRQ